MRVDGWYIAMGPKHTPQQVFTLAYSILNYMLYVKSVKSDGIIIWLLNWASSSFVIYHSTLLN